MQHRDEVSSLWNPNSVSLLYDAAGSSCSLQCETSDEEASTAAPFKFATGQGYTYDYTIVTSTMMKGTSRQESRAEIKATVELRAESPCDYHLKVSA